MRFTGLLVIAAMGCSGQTPHRSVEGYIESVFEQQAGQLPRMGWFAPEYGFIARESAAAELVVLGPLGTGAWGRRSGRLSGRAWGRRAEYGIGCELSETDSVGVYRVQGETRPRRALYLTRKMRGEVRRGLVIVGMDGAALARVNRLLGWPERGALRRDTAYGVSGESLSYSRHRLYDAKSKLLREEAILLHGGDGGIIAHAVHRGIDTGGHCDGCAAPSYGVEVSGLYRPLQMFGLPGFAYPVLLLDTSTFENEGLTLLTVTHGGNVTQFRVSEYVMHCR